MIIKELSVHNEEGLHSRPAMEFSKLASRFHSSVIIEKEDADFNAKSMLMVLSACVCCGDSFLLKIDGDDEKAAMDALTAWIGTLNGEE